MPDLLILLVHLITTTARLMGPGGARSVIAESLLVKHQLLRHCQLVEGSALLPREIDAPDRSQQAHVTASHSTNARVRSRRW